MREEPYLKANLEIVEARSLVGKDMSGSSDPFCTCYLTTNPISRFNTSYKVRFSNCSITQLSHVSCNWKLECRTNVVRNRSGQNQWVFSPLTVTGYATFVR